jgi:dTDP-4-dehydrorhamnose 3,5-epimerase-like enzyme
MGYGTYAIGATKVYNVSVVNEQYQLANPATVVWDDRGLGVTNRGS